MLLATQLCGFGAGGVIPPARIVLTDHLRDGSSSFVANIGAANPSRVLAVYFAWSTGGNGPTSITVDGNATTIRADASIGGVAHGVVMGTIPWPTGTTATIAHNAAAGNHLVGVYAVYDAGGEVPVDIVIAGTGAIGTINGTISIPRDGVAGAIATNSFSDVTWTGFTELVEDTNGTRTTLADVETMLAKDLNFAWSIAGNTNKTILASWAPVSPPTTATWIAGVRDTSGSSASHNYSIDCGTGGEVVVALAGVFNGTFATCSIGGQTADIVVQSQAGGNGAPVALAIATNVPSGTQTVAVTTSAGNTVWYCMTYVMTNCLSLTPTATGSDSDVTGGSSGNLSNPANGCTIGMTQCGNGGTPVTWTGLTKDDTQGSGVNQAASAHENFTSANASLAWTTSFGGSNNQTSSVWASWGQP